MYFYQSSGEMKTICDTHMKKTINYSNLISHNAVSKQKINTNENKFTEHFGIFWKEQQLSTIPMTQSRFQYNGADN
jgi:hypothetical protein